MQQNYNKKTTPTAHRTLAGTLLTLLYRVYVLFVFLPLFLVSSVITATVTAISGAITPDGYGDSSLSVPFCCP